MDDRFIIRISPEEKEEMLEISRELGISLSALARSRLLGEELTYCYIEHIKNKIESVQEGEVFTLKSLIPTHWKYLSKGERKNLIDVIVDTVDEDELPIDVYKLTRRGKFKFIKIENERNMKCFFNGNLNEDDYE